MGVEGRTGIAINQEDPAGGPCLEGEPATIVGRKIVLSDDADGSVVEARLFDPRLKSHDPLRAGHQIDRLLDGRDAIQREREADPTRGTGLC